MCIVSLVCKLMSLTITVVAILIILAILGVYDPPEIPFDSKHTSGPTTIKVGSHNVTWKGYATYKDDSGQYVKYQLKLDNARVDDSQMFASALVFNNKAELRVYPKNEFSLVFRPNPTMDIINTQHKIKCVYNNNKVLLNCESGEYTDSETDVNIIVETFKIIRL